MKRGFQNTTLHVDDCLEPLQALIQLMTGVPIINLESASEYVPEMERQIWWQGKDNVYKTSLSFNKVPKLFLIHLIFQAIKILKHFPVKGGISDTISLTTIMKYESLHY